MKFLSIIIAALFVISSSLAWAQGTVINRILVKVNNSIITQYDLDERLRPVLDKIKGRVLSAAEERQLADLRKKVVGDMISDILIEQEAQKYGVEVGEDVLDDEIERVKKENQLDDEAFEAQVAADGLTMEDFRERLRRIITEQEIVGQMVNKKVLVTDSEIQAEYEARRDDYTLDKMVEVAIIILPMDVSAVEVKTRIEDGEMSFAEAVSKYSVGPAADSGGSIGQMKWADLAEDWRNSLRGVPEGGLSEPLTIQGGEALLSPVTVSENAVVPLEDVRDDLYRELMAKKRETIFTDYFSKLRESAVIIYMDEELMPDNGVAQ